MAICTTAYLPGAIPDLDLRQIFELHQVAADLRLACANKGLRTCALFAALGDTQAAAITTLKAIISTSEPPWDTDTAVKVMQSLTLGASWSDAMSTRTAQAAAKAKVQEDPSKVPALGLTDWTAMRSAFLTRHPELPMDDAVEPHRRFIETLKRDVLLHGRVPFIELSRVYVKADGPVLQTGQVIKALDDVLKVNQHDASVNVGTATQVLNRITALLYGLECIGVMPLTASTGLMYLKELRIHGRKHVGHDYLVSVDRMFRTEVDERLTNDNSLAFATTFEQVLLDRRDFWITAAQEAALAKIPSTPTRKGTKRSADDLDEDETVKQPKGRGRDKPKKKRPTVAQLKEKLTKQLHTGDKSSSGTANAQNSAQAPPHN